MGSDLSGFLENSMVRGLIGLTCFMGILLIIMILLIVYMRQRKAAKERQAVASVPGFATIASEHDMPDLALLVNAPPAPIQEAVPLASLVQPPMPPPAPARPARKGTFTIRTQDGAASEAVEVMSILRDVVDGQLIVQMGDKAYQNIASSPEAKDRFTKIMRELGQIAAQTSSASVQSGESANAPTSPEQEEEIEQPPVMEAEPPPPVQKPRSASAPPPVPRSGVMPGDLPSFKLADNPMIKPKRGQKLDLKPVPEINIAGAIEAYLQYKLQQTPDFVGRSIHIYPAPDGGVSIEVDGQYYDAVGDVADTGVREFISTAIQEWQERH